MKFQDLNIISPILNALTEQGYEAPTPIQEQALPPALKGRDVLGCAQTGTGKTCAFAVPILQRLYAKENKSHPVRALILTPTRELAIQIQECFEAYGKYLPLRSTVIFGGVGQSPQVEALKKGTDILVATPGRLQDLHNQGLVNVDALEVLVLDEADRMLDMGFIHDVKRILAWLPKRKQTLFFSATMPAELNSIVASLLHNPVRVAVDPISSPVERIEQKLYYVDKNNKTRLLVDLLEQEQVTSALVFTRTKHGANKVATELSKRGVAAEAIHGNKSQTARQNALNGFKAGTVRVLVATDIAARGLDIEELPYVFNYNLPDVPETYVHRIGRTGRAGREGIAISFCDITEKDMLKGIEKLTGKTIPVVEAHPYPMVVLEAPMKDKRGRIINPEDQEAREAARQRKQQKAAERAAGIDKEAKQVEHMEKAAGGQTGQDKKKKKKKSGGKKFGDRVEKVAVQEATPDYQVETPEDETMPTILRPTKRERSYTRPVRTTSLEDFLKEITGDSDSDDYSDFPLLEQRMREEREGDRFLDATDRMFATHSSRYRDSRGGRGTSRQDHSDHNRDRQEQEDSRRQEQKSGNGKRKNGKGQQKQSAQEKRTPEQTAQQQKPQKVKQKAQKQKKGAPKATTTEPVVQSRGASDQGKKSGGKSAGKDRTKQNSQKSQPVGQPEAGRLLTVKQKKKRTYSTPRPMERSPYATQKDSTEQKSLMKPYYIDKKD